MLYSDILIRLLVAHLLGDFFLQPDSWVTSKKEKKFRSIHHYLHALIHGVLAYLLLSQWNSFAIPFIIFVTHLMIDLSKSHFKSDIRSFVLDQLAHFFVLLVLAVGMQNSGYEFTQFWLKNLQNQNLWFIVLGYLLLTKPAGVLIQLWTKPWQKELKNTEDEDSLSNAGKWIGYLERILTFTFILVGQFSAIGFLIAAKSIFRFGDLTNSKERKNTEYILIGTFLSFTLAILIGILITKFPSI